MTENARAKSSEHPPSSEEPVELTVLARMAGVRVVHARRYLEFGLFEPENPRLTSAATSGPPLRFVPTSAARLARAERLRRDLDLNYAGAVLAVELLERINQLERRLVRSPGRADHLR